MENISGSVHADVYECQSDSDGLVSMLYASNDFNGFQGLEYQWAWAFDVVTFLIVMNIFDQCCVLTNLLSFLSANTLQNN